MQGKLTIKNVWSNINDLDLTDANGGALDFTVTSGDTVKFYYAEKIANQVLLYQGTAPTGDNDEGCIAIEGNVILGVGADAVFVKARDVARDITVEIVKGA